MSQSNSKRIAKNTLMLYFRMLFLMIVSLYTSRVILDALGVEDYGIYNVVGGFVAMFGLVSAALTSACSRFLNYEMGVANIQRQIIVFSTSVTIQWTLAIIVAILAEIIGVWYINNVMVIPATRLQAANWCFQFSVFNFCMNIVTVPYNASIIAHEKMNVFAFISIFQGLGILIISFLVYLETFDRLVFYSLMLLILQLSIRIIYQIYCKRSFEECRYKMVFDKPLLRQMLSYSLWHLVGNGASILKTHGVNLVLNLFFGPTINAAKGISAQVETAVGQFSGNFMMALNPQITQSYARGDFSYMFTLIEKGSRYSFYLLFFLSLPIILNTEYILNLWLKEVPEYAVIFVQLSLIVMMISSISRPLITAQNATGNVRNYQLIIGGIVLLNLPISYVMLLVVESPIVVMIVAISVEVLAMFTRIFIIPQTIKDFHPFIFLKKVAIHCFFISFLSLLLPLSLKCFVNSQNFSSFLMNSLLCFISSAFVVWTMGCSQGERKVLISKIKSIINKYKK